MVSKMTINIAIVTTFLLFGCEKHEDYNHMTSDEIIIRMEKLIKPYDESDVHKIDFSKIIAPIISNIKNPQILADVLIKSYNKRIGINKGNLFFTTLYYNSLEVDILTALENINTEASTQVLVELLVNPEMEWDAARALNIRHSVSKCGKKALPYLRIVIAGCKDKKECYYDLIKHIENGKIYGL